MAKRILVCGGRDFADRRRLGRALIEFAPRNATCPNRETVIIHGGAPGADSLAGEWADLWSLRSEAFEADWQAHGSAAGPIRNQRMIDDGKPDLVIAFPGGRGTADMVRRARAAGIEVREIAS